MTDRPIIVFDSGRGGQSIYIPLKAALPNANILYIEDHEHFPYGNKSSAWLSARFKELGQQFAAKNPILVVLACNTATVNVVDELRAYLTCPVVGVEPVIKPLSAYARTLVLMTASSAASAKTTSLLHKYGQNVQVYTPHGLAEAIEYNNNEQVKKNLHEIKEIVQKNKIEVVGLSCTHYPLILNELQEAMPAVKFIDPANAVVEQVVRVLRLTQHMNSFLSHIQGKKVLVFGLGRQGGGQGDVEWLKKHGAEVKVSDKDLSLAPEGHNQADIDWADLIIKNPAVRDDHELITYAHSIGKPVETSIALFVKYSPFPIIGVTGTRGKSTTVALIAALLEKTYPGQVVTGGNIPDTSGLALFDQVEGKKYAVLELSSFQLHGLHDLKVSPHLAVITNLYPDHLDRYQSMEEYRKDKEAICQYQQKSDFCIYNADNPGAVQISEVSPAKHISYTVNDCLNWKTNIPGSHNRENIAAMWAVGKILDIPEELCRQVVQDFHGLPFRQESIREVGGVTFVNDTTATTPIATLKAIAAQTAPTVLICGGATKNLPYDVLVKTIAENPLIKQIIFLGSQKIPEFISAIRDAAPDKILGQVDSMSEAVRLAVTVAKPGWIVLLSPGFSSFDLFQNEFDRGRQFNDVVRNL